MITNTITSNSFNKNTNNSIEGNIPLFSAKKTSNNNLNDFAVSFGPLYDQPFNQQHHLVNDATYTLSPAKTKNVYKLHSFSTNADIATILWQKFVDKPAKYIKPI